MTIGAGLVLVAIRALKSVEVDVLVVVERHDVPLVVRGFVEEPRRPGNDGVRPAGCLNGRPISGWDRRALLVQGVAARALERSTVPGAMATHTLSVVSPFEIGLGNVGPVAVAVVAITARHDASRRVVVVTQRAAAGHGRHFGVQPMGERDRCVQAGRFGHLIDHDCRGPRRGGVLHSDHVLTGTAQQTGVGSGGDVALVAGCALQ